MSIAKGDVLKKKSFWSDKTPKNPLILINHTKKTENLKSSLFL